MTTATIPAMFQETYDVGVTPYLSARPEDIPHFDNPMIVRVTQRGALPARLLRNVDPTPTIFAALRYPHRPEQARILLSTDDGGYTTPDRPEVARGWWVPSQYFEVIREGRDSVRNQPSPTPEPTEAQPAEDNLPAEPGALRDLIAEERARTARLLDILNDEATNRGWCSEYEEVLERAGFPGRTETFEGSLTVRWTIPASLALGESGLMAEHVTRSSYLQMETEFSHSVEGRRGSCFCGVMDDTQAEQALKQHLLANGVDAAIVDALTFEEANAEDH